MADLPEIVKNLYLSIVLLAIIYVIGTIFYHNVERWSLLDSVYFITVTLATVGYGDIHPVTNLGKVFTIFLILTGVSIFLSLIYSLAAYRERTFDKELLARLSIFRNLTAIRGSRFDEKKKPPKFLQSMGSNLGEV
jgi:hypothetical protein